MAEEESIEGAAHYDSSWWAFLGLLVDVRQELQTESADLVEEVKTIGL